jgi:hypothetical protein
MLPVKETDHVGTSLALLLDQYKGKTFIKGYLSTLARRVQDVENVLWDIIELRRLDVATGAQLDALGKLVGERRIGRNDTDYRTGIRIRIRVNRSKGRTVDVIDVAMLAAGIYPPKYIDYPFLNFEVDLFGQTGERYLADLLSRTRAASSYGILVASDLAASSLLIWDDAVSPSGAQTFSDAISGGLVCASAYGLPSDFSGIVLVTTVAPTVSGISTSGGAVGDIDGTYPCALVGTNFVIGATTFAVGGTPLTSVVVSSPTNATAVMPAKASGTYSVTATTSGGTSPGTTTFEYFSPAQLALTEWHRAPFASAPWAANASAGSSSGRTATSTGFDPTPGTALNGKAPAHFDRASSQSLNAGAANNVLFSAGAGTFMCLARTTTQQAPIGTDYGDGNLFNDPSNAETTMGIVAGGFVAAIYAGAYKRAPLNALANATWGACEAVWDSTNLTTRVNGNTQSVAAGAWTPITPSTPRIGLSYGNGYLDGDVPEWMTSATAIPQATRDKIRSYLNTRYFPLAATV